MQRVSKAKQKQETLALVFHFLKNTQNFGDLVIIIITIINIIWHEQSFFIS